MEMEMGSMGNGIEWNGMDRGESLDCNMMNEEREKRYVYPSSLRYLTYLAFLSPLSKPNLYLPFSLPPLSASSSPINL